MIFSYLIYNLETPNIQILLSYKRVTVPTSFNRYQLIKIKYKKIPASVTGILIIAQRLQIHTLK